MLRRELFLFPCVRGMLRRELSFSPCVGGMLRRELSLFPTVCATVRREPPSHHRFTVDCWFLPPCAGVLSVAGFRVFPAWFPFHCWASWRSSITRFTVGHTSHPFHCWTYLRSLPAWSS